MEHLELTWQERGRLWLRLGIRLVLTVLAAVLLLRMGPPLLSLFMPFVLALLMAWILNPIIKLIQRRLGISRKILSLLLLILIFAVVGGLVTVLVYNMAVELKALFFNWENIWASALKPAINNIEVYFSDLFAGLPVQVAAVANSALDQLVTWLYNNIPAMASRAGGAAGSFAFSIPSFAVAAIIFIMATFFISSDYPRLRFLALDKLSDNLHGFLSDVKHTAVAAFGGYAKAEFLLSVGVFFILLLGFFIIRQPYSVLLAFLFSVVDFIPIVGSGTFMIPWAVVDIFTGNYRHAVEIMVIWGIIALFRRIAEPKFVGDHTGLSPILSLVSIYVGMQVAGVWGMILGPILCMILLNIYRLGVLDNMMADLRLAVGDLSALLKHRPPQSRTEE